MNFHIQIRQKTRLRASRVLTGSRNGSQSTSTIWRKFERAKFANLLSLPSKKVASSSAKKVNRGRRQMKNAKPWSRNFLSPGLQKKNLFAILIELFASRVDWPGWIDNILLCKMTYFINLIIRHLIIQPIKSFCSLKCFWLTAIQHIAFWHFYRNSFLVS